VRWAIEGMFEVHRIEWCELRLYIVHCVGLASFGGNNLQYNFSNTGDGMPQDFFVHGCGCVSLTI
jgi:hypothetical protein